MDLPSMLLALTVKPSSLVISKRRWGWFIYVRFLCLGPKASSSELNPVSDVKNNMKQLMKRTKNCGTSLDASKNSSQNILLLTL